MKEKVTEHISKYIDLSTAELEAIHELIEVRSFKKDTLLLREGDISKYAYFNIQGCVRTFSIVQGIEKTTYFHTENRFITSIRSFTEKNPANHNLECVEDCVLAVFSYESEKSLLERFPKFERLSRILLEEELGVYQDILSNYITSNPEERYRNLMESRPDLLQRIPQYHLATYLGITPQSLSRIRSRMIDKESS